MIFKRKTVLTTCCALLVCTGIAGAKDYKDKGLYLGYSATKSSSSNKNIAGGIKASEILGSGSLVHNFKFGGYTTPTNSKIGGKVYFGLLYDSSLNNEFGINTGLVFEKKITDTYPLSVSFGAEAGYGLQSVKGDKKKTSSGEVVLTKKIPAAHLGLNLGLSYRVSDNFSADLSYAFRTTRYEAHYENNFFRGATRWDEIYHGARLGINYHF